MNEFSGSIAGPIFRKRWMEFVSHNLINLFQKSGVFLQFIGNIGDNGAREEADGTDTSVQTVGRSD